MDGQFDVPRHGGSRYLAGPIASVDHVAQTVAEKTASESKPARSRWKWKLPRYSSARSDWGVPFYCVRAVSDTAQEGFGWI